VAVSAAGLAITGGVELALALFTGSVGLLGDALHNLSDVSTSAVVFVGFRISKRRPTPRYPYGYERAEDLAGLGVALVIWASALFAGIESYRKFVDHSTTSHVGWGMVGAVLGVVGNQAVARYKLATGKRIQSATLMADARHSWLDALSSAGAFVGLVGVALGYRWADPVAGFVITAFIAHVGWKAATAHAPRRTVGSRTGAGRFSVTRRGGPTDRATPTSRGCLASGGQLFPVRRGAPRFAMPRTR
jgi:cation diffusion facilitator family transporter